MIIRDALESELDDVLEVVNAAFGPEEVPELVRNLLVDQSAKPLLSLLAIRDDRPVGHVLFTAVHLEPGAPVKMSILAPLAVAPEFQRQGIGGRLVGHGLKVLGNSGVGLVFVLGHPEYYPRHGFRPAGAAGFEAPYPIPEENAEAWMVRELKPGIVGKWGGKVMCAESMNRPHYWRE